MTPRICVAAQQQDGAWVGVVKVAGAEQWRSGLTASADRARKLAQRMANAFRRERQKARQ